MQKQKNKQFPKNIVKNSINGMLRIRAEFRVIPYFLRVQLSIADHRPLHYTHTHTHTLHIN